MARKVNLIDSYRLLAAFSIVLLHIDYYQNLSNFSQDFVTFIQQLFMSWALPFFYFTTARFSLLSNYKNHSYQKLFGRIKNLIFLVVVYTTLLFFTYLGKKLFLKNGFDFSNISYAWETIKSLNPTSAYFLLHVILISTTSYLLHFFCKGKLGKLFVSGLLLIVLVSTIASNNVVSQFYNLELSHTLIIGTTVGYLYVLSSIKPKVFLKKISTTGFLNLLLIPILLFGIPSVLFSKTPQIQKIFLASFGFFILYVGDRYKNLNTNSSIRLISEYGQKYTLGIFVTHPIIMKFLNILIPSFIALIFSYENSILVYILISLTVMISSLWLVKIIKKIFPPLVSI